jgi:hypothetical protein
MTFYASPLPVSLLCGLGDARHVAAKSMSLEKNGKSWQCFERTLGLIGERTVWCREVADIRLPLLSVVEAALP